MNKRIRLLVACSAFLIGIASALCWSTIVERLLTAKISNRQKIQPKPIELYGLPTGTIIAELHDLSSVINKPRKLVLWVQNPIIMPDPNLAEPYLSLAETRGSYYTGLTGISLIDTTTNKIINTVLIKNDSEAEQTFDLPYLIRKNQYYFAAGATEMREAKPQIMHLQDINGDGQPLEFALYEQQNSMQVDCTLLGYSIKQDRIIQYPVILAEHNAEKNQTSTSINFWADNLYNNKPISAGHWQYQLDYRGRGGALMKYDIRYNSNEELFEGTLTSIDSNGNDEVAR